MSASNDAIRRAMGMDMLVGDHYDMADQVSSVTTEVLCQPGESMHDWTNNWGVPVKLRIRDGKIQQWIPVRTK